MSLVCVRVAHCSQVLRTADFDTANGFAILNIDEGWPSELRARSALLKRIQERDIWVHSFRMPPEANNSIKMEVGIEDCLHIEFEYNKSK